MSCLCPNAVYTGMFGRPHGDSFLRKATDYDAWIARTRNRLLAMR